MDLCECRKTVYTVIVLSYKAANRKHNEVDIFMFHVTFLGSCNKNINWDKQHSDILVPQ